MGGTVNMRKVFRLNLFILLISTLVLAACGGDDKDTETDLGKDGEPEETDENTLTFGLGNDMVTWDVHDHRDTTSEAIQVNVFNYLIENDDGEFLPDLATEWEAIDDETWEFTLRDDVKFHNGDEFTAEDVKFTLERVAKDEKLEEHQNFRQIKEV